MDLSDVFFMLAMLCAFSGVVVLVTVLYGVVYGVASGLLVGSLFLAFTGWAIYKGKGS